MAALFFLLMTGLFIAGSSSLWNDHRLDSNHASAPGTVDEVGSTSSGNGQMWITFRTGRGRIMKHVEVDWDGHSHDGDAVTVQYLPNEPGTARVGGRGRFNSIAMAVIGLLGMIAAGYGLLTPNTRRRRP